MSYEAVFIKTEPELIIDDTAYDVNENFRTLSPSNDYLKQIKGDQKNLKGKPRKQSRKQFICEICNKSFDQKVIWTAVYLNMLLPVILRKTHRG